MSRLWIIGAGGHGKVVAEIASMCGYTDIMFLDQSWPGRRDNGGWPIVGKPGRQPDGHMFCAIGRNDIRARMFAEFGLDDSPVLADPRSVLSPSATLGAGTVVIPGVVVNASARIGKGCILNTGCSVGHDCELADFTQISPGARLAGGVTVGEESWIGMGAVIREGCRIGRNAVIAAGAAVIRDVPDGARVAGVPARPIVRSGSDENPAG